MKKDNASKLAFWKRFAQKLYVMIDPSKVQSTGNRSKPKTVFSKRMIHPRRHSFSKRDPFITVYTRAENKEHVIPPYWYLVDIH